MPEPHVAFPQDKSGQTPSWHALPPDEAGQLLSSSRQGLTGSEASARLARWGPNELPTTPPRKWWLILQDQFRSVVMALLLAAVLISWISGDSLEAAAIGVVVLINAGIGFATELRARRAIQALAQLQAARAIVLRDGQFIEVAAEAVVPGDVVALEEGQRVPADLRLVEAEGLRVDEAILTGESLPVTKDPDATLADNVAQHARLTMAFQGTAVVAGSARGFVSATGQRTAVGRIGQLLEGAPDEATPLERKLDALGHQLIWLTLGVVAAVSVVGLLRGLEATLMIKTGIALAVAAVPEGLPAIATIALAVGVRRMARKKALVRRLPSVETLGSVTVVCTDKTGTLTAGRMEAGGVWQPVDGDEPLLWTCATLANRAAALRRTDPEAADLDPTEVALLKGAMSQGIDAAAIHDEHPTLGEVPFTAAARYMASLHQTESGPRWFAKGSPVAILERCTSLRTANRDEPLTDIHREQVLAASDDLAAQGLRVLGFAVSRADESRSTVLMTREEPAGLSFVGLIGLIDPPAPGVRDTVAQFRRAGIRVIMVTGDHHLTAKAVGEALEIDTVNEPIDMSSWSAEDTESIAAAVKSTSIFARVSPEQKVDIVKALQESGEVVAMLGDGVNDAAALKHADVGVAMGGRGAEVARQASEIVLQDDRFETVGAAVSEGRTVFANIRKFAFFLFSCNLAEVLVILVATLLGWPIPLLPLQILWLNMVTDTFPALALAFEPGEPGLMRQPPRPPATPILGPRELKGILIYAGAITAVALIACYVGLQAEPGGGARTMTLTFATLALAQVLHLGNARSRGPVLAPSEATSNRYAIGGAGVSIALLFVAVTFPPLSAVLGVTPLGTADWLLVVALGALPAILGQSAKLITSRRVPQPT